METKKYTKIICGHCGHSEERTDVSHDHVYFPNRYVHDNVGFAISCYHCHNMNDMILFGKNFISGAFDFSLLEIPEVIENNRIWTEAQNAIKEAARRAQSVNTWARGFTQSLRTQRNYKARLKELETFDHCNHNPEERAIKIDALKTLIKN